MEDVIEASAGLAPTWTNWSGNLRHRPPADGAPYCFRPKTLDELKALIAEARQRGVPVRVTGQRHSQPPLVAADNRTDPAPALTTYLVDMSCYVDVGEDGIALGPGPNQITVNPGVREDAVEAFLTRHDLMFQTVTAGGFFSLGGMTAVDVHGGTVTAPIFAETASAFTLLGADGELTTIDAASPATDGWHPLQFARVSLGALGVVTRITIDVLPRPWATTLQGGRARYLLADKGAFVAKFREMLTGPARHDRLEVFYTPYAAPWGIPNFLALWWNVVDDPQPRIPNSAQDPAAACALSEAGQFGAPFLGELGSYAAKYVRASQYYSSPYDPLHFPPVPPSGYAAIALDEIERQVDAGNAAHSELWLTEASQVMFMSYFIELPDLDEAGLAKVWDGLEVVAKRVVEDDAFHIAAPLEFRFVRGGDSALSATYSTRSTSTFVNLDLIGFIEPTPSAEYPDKLLGFFAAVEREWVAMGGFPHNGKMYGFYDPALPNSHGPAFNSGFLADLRRRRGDRLNAFVDFRSRRDPEGVFLNAFGRTLLGI